MTDEGKRILPAGIKFSLNNGYPPKEAVFERDAIVMLIKYSNQDNAVSQNKLATLIENGIGIFQSYEEAHKLYGKAANSGCAKSKYDLGRLYAEGKGVKLDFREAYRCFFLAIQGGFDARNAIETVKEKLTEHEIKMMESLCTDRAYFYQHIEKVIGDKLS